MKRGTMMLGIGLVAGAAATGQDRPATRPAAAGAGRPPTTARPGEVGRPRRIYIPIPQSDRIARGEALELRELLGKAIERDTAARVVARPEDADLILELALKPATQPQP